MPKPTAPLLVCLLAFLIQASPGCGEREPAYQHTYTTRGVIVAMPGDKAYEEFIVRHEPIPDYVSMNGSIGMASMAMPFPLKDRSLVEGLAVGDKIEITYGETFEPDFDAGVISIKKLPADTALNLNAAAGAKPQAAGEEGFVPIFDGASLDGWEGDSRYWTVEDGAIIGQFTEDNPLEANTFLIWRGGENGEPAGGVVGDFELKFSYRISEGGNSGVQYRSQQTDGFGMKGYQADIHHGPRWTGICYDEHGRQVLADRGQSVVLEAGKQPDVVEQFGDPAALMQSIDLDGWNEYHIIAKGNRLMHKINGVRMAEVLDNDEDEREMRGLLGLQIHRGTPVRVAFKHILLKTID